MILSLLAAALTLQAVPPLEDEARRFVFLGAGRFAQYADMGTLETEGTGGRIRVLQVSEPGFAVGGRVYWGGWSWWAFDCDSGMVDRLDFASVQEGGAEGPATPEPGAAYLALQGGDAFEMLVAACNPGDHEIDFTTLEDAVEHGRSQLAL